tara:strand:+ start:55625 stop:56224 length:600 start_codon:yes stop_codon:yes gene_type:complete
MKLFFSFCILIINSSLAGDLNIKKIEDLKGVKPKVFSQCEFKKVLDAVSGSELSVDSIKCKKPKLYSCDSDSYFIDVEGDSINELDGIIMIIPNVNLDKILDVGGLRLKIHRRVKISERIFDYNLSREALEIKLDQEVVGSHLVVKKINSLNKQIDKLIKKNSDKGDVLTIGWEFNYQYGQKTFTLTSIPCFRNLKNRR